MLSASERMSCRRSLTVLEACLPVALLFSEGSRASRETGLDAQRHDRVDNVVVVFFQCLDRLLARHAGLRLDQLNVLVLNARGIDLVVIVILLLLLSLVIGAVVVVVVVVVIMVVVVAVAGVVVVVARQLLGSGRLGTGVEVLNLGLAEDAVSLVRKRVGMEDKSKTARQ